jgi:hypothetical protein
LYHENSSRTRSGREFTRVLSDFCSAVRKAG